MIFNTSYGSEMALAVQAASFTNVSSAGSKQVTLSVEPLMILLRTTVGTATELCAYYRADQSGNFTMKLSSEGTVKSRLSAVEEGVLSFTVTGAGSSSVATIECYLMGVNRT